MPEQEDSGFKVTDRRKFKPDGTPREGAEDAPVAAEREAAASDREAAAGNILSFPGEAQKKPSQPSPSARPANLAGDPGWKSPPAADEPTAAGRAERAYNQARGPQSTQLPEASFLSLVNMLGVEAAMHLGLIRAPGEEAPPIDTEAARHLIDMLGILQTKTRGNLTAEEDDLFENMLADLRVRFVEMSKRR